MKKLLCMVVLSVVGISLAFYSPTASWAQGRPDQDRVYCPSFRWNGVKREGHVSRF